MAFGKVKKLDYLKEFYGKTPEQIHGISISAKEKFNDEVRDSLCPYLLRECKDVLAENEDTVKVYPFTPKTLAEMSKADEESIYDKGNFLLTQGIVVEIDGQKVILGLAGFKDWDDFQDRAVITVADLLDEI